MKFFCLLIRGVLVRVCGVILDVRLPHDVLEVHKESVVATLGMLFGKSVSTAISSASAASLLVFSLLYTPCVAAIASIKREMGGRWAFAVVIWQCVVAWAVSFVVYLIAGAIM